MGDVRCFTFFVFCINLCCCCFCDAFGLWSTMELWWGAILLGDCLEIVSVEYWL